jgi:hypothetical protein
VRILVALALSTLSLVASAQERSFLMPKLLETHELQMPIEQGALQRQFDALSAMQLELLEYSPHGPVKLLRGNTGLALPAHVGLLKQGDTAPSALSVFRDLFLAEGSESAVVRSNAAIEGSQPVLRLSETIRGIQVHGGRIAIEYDAETLRVSGISAHFVPDRGLPRQPSLTARQAEQRVVEAVQAAEETRGVEVAIRDGTYLAYFADRVHDAPPALVWVVTALGSTEFLVDACTGAIVHEHSEVIPNRAERRQ